MQSRSILVLSYDFVGATIHDRVEMEWKIRRDGYSADDSFLIISWSKKRETIRLSERIIVEAFPAFIGNFRPVYDLLFPFIAPRIVRKHGFKPDRISIGEFALAPGARAVQKSSGGEIVVRLIGLPRDIARTRSVFHLAYCVFAEWLARGIAERCVAINEATRDYAIARGVPAKSVSILPLDSIKSDGGLVESAKRGEARRELGIPEGVPFILSVGRLEAEKAFDELIDIFAASKLAAWLVILGEGSMRPELEARAKRYPQTTIVLPGKKSRADVWSYFKDASAFALLSKSEGLGLVFWEAMWVNTPTIGRPVGGIKETIGQDGLRGFFWDSEDGPEAFRSKVQRCIDGGAEIAAMTARARAYVGEKIGME